MSQFSFSGFVRGAGKAFSRAFRRSKRDRLLAASPVRASIPWPYFDPVWYAERYPDIREAGVDPFVHYRLHGWRERRQPSLYFDADYYATSYIDDAPEIDPLTHYLEKGWKNGCQPHTLFSPSWYLAENRDVADAGGEPLEHYALFGWREGRDPSPYFDTKWYLDRNQDVKEASVDPLAHYIRFGHGETGRDPNPFFDGDWYRMRYPGAALWGADPLSHYIEVGARAGYQPSPNFDASYYLEHNPDIDRKVDPFLHYLQQGRFERRKAHPDMQEAPDQRVLEWARRNMLTRERIDRLGNDLGLELERPSPSRAAERTYRAAIANAQCVTFDIFDTLIERRCGKPENIFHLVGLTAKDLGFVGDFVALRIEAELLARREAGIREVTLGEIYDQVSRLSSLSGDACLTLSKIEIDTEIAMSIPKPAGLALYRAARESGLPIYLLTDIYLPKSAIVTLLDQAGISGYTELFVSSELGSTKHHGGTYRLLLDHTGIAPKAIVHVGDNVHSDLAMADQHGIRGLRIAKTGEMLPHCVTRAWYVAGGSEAGRWKAVVAGNLASRFAGKSLFAEPQDPLSGFFEVGARSLGPVLLAFAAFLAQKAKLLGYRKLYFASRDGFYLKEAYDALRVIDGSLPESAYFLASRRVCRAASVRTGKDIAAVAAVDHFPMSIEALLRARFLLTDEDVAAMPSAVRGTLQTVVRSSKDDPTLKSVLEACEAMILRRAGAHGTAYRAYLKRIGLGEEGSAIVDIGYRGTVQIAVSDMLDRRIGGFYFVTWPEARKLLDKGLSYDAFMKSSGSPNDPVVQYVQLLELLFSATHGTVSHFEMVDGVPVPIMGEPDMDADSLIVLNGLRAGAIAFVQDMAERFPVNFILRPPEGATVIEALVELFATPPVSVVDSLKRHRFEDAFGGETRSLVSQPGAGLSYHDALRASCWPEGTARLWESGNSGPASLDAGYGVADSFDGDAILPGFAAFIETLKESTFS